MKRILTLGRNISKEIKPRPLICYGAEFKYFIRTYVVRKLNLSRNYSNDYQNINETLRFRK